MHITDYLASWLITSNALQSLSLAKTKYIFNFLQTKRIYIYIYTFFFFYISQHFYNLHFSKSHCPASFSVSVSVCMCPAAPRAEVNIVLLLEAGWLFTNAWRSWFLWRLWYCYLISVRSLFLTFRATLQLWPHFLKHFLLSAWTPSMCSTITWRVLLLVWYQSTQMAEQTRMFAMIKVLLWRTVASLYNLWITFWMS